MPLVQWHRLTIQHYPELRNTDGIDVDISAHKKSGPRNALEIKAQP